MSKYGYDIFPSGDWTGSCYEVSLLMMSPELDLTLVHGICIGRGPIEGVEFGHAWCEDDEGYCYDGTVKAIMRKEDFYMLGGVQYTHEYSFREMAEEVVRTGVYGPWDPVILDERISRKVAMEGSYDWLDEGGDTWTRLYEDGWIGSVAPCGWYDSSRGACFVLSDDGFLARTQVCEDCDTTEEARRLCDEEHTRLTGRTSMRKGNAMKKRALSDMRIDDDIYLGETPWNQCTIMTYISDNDLNKWGYDIYLNDREWITGTSRFFATEDDAVDDAIDRLERSDFNSVSMGLVAPSKQAKKAMKKKAEMDKEQFVAGPFTDAVRETRAGIDHLYYVQEGYDEFVYIVYDNGFERPVCVTMDSNAAIMLDVITEILRH